MPTFIPVPVVVESAGNKPITIEEHVGNINTQSGHVSVARLITPAGWIEPGQRPDFEEITVVLKGMLRIEHVDGHTDVQAGQSIITHLGEWVRYSSPADGGAEYIAVCLPAYTLKAAHRDPAE